MKTKKLAFIALLLLLATLSVTTLVSNGYTISVENDYSVTDTFSTSNGAIGIMTAEFSHGGLSSGDFASTDLVSANTTSCVITVIWKGTNGTLRTDLSEENYHSSCSVNGKLWEATDSVDHSALIRNGSMYAGSVVEAD